MASWKVISDAKTNGYTHRVTEGFGHALLSQVVADVFRVLRVSAALVNEEGYWFRIHGEPSLTSFELEHGREAERFGYNHRHLTRVRKRGVTVLGEHAGYADCFVPVRVDAQTVAVLVTGPFALARPTSADILERWRWLSDRHGHPSDPEFSSYLSASLATLVLTPARVAAFRTVLEQLAELLAGRGRADELASLADEPRRELEAARLVERTWEGVRTMLDERSSRIWASGHRAHELAQLGLSRPPNDVLVALSVGSARDVDPVEEAVQRDAFQRSAIALARSVGDVIAGQVGDHGVVLLSASRGGIARRKQRLLDLAERAKLLARRRFGLSLYFGASSVLDSAPLARSFQRALAAAESALVRRATHWSVGTVDAPNRDALRDLRRELTQAGAEHAELLPARFDRYLEAVALQCGYRLDLARGQLDFGFECVAEPLVKRAELDEKSCRSLCDILVRSASAARTLDDLFSAYRRAILDVAEAVKRPLHARHDRSLRRAIEYIHQRYTEPLSAPRVARVAGFTPNYFSTLFKLRERRSFASYVCALRIERAAQLLTATNLDVKHVGELCGFNSAQYFSRVFQRIKQETPQTYRARTSSHDKSKRAPKKRTIRN
jgi:AraC-like DNA-binding protein